MSGNVLKFGNEGFGRELYFDHYDHFQRKPGRAFNVGRNGSGVWPVNEPVEKPEEVQMTGVVKDAVPVITNGTAGYGWLSAMRVLILKNPVAEYDRSPIFLDVYSIYDEETLLKRTIITDLPVHLMNGEGDTLQNFYQDGRGSGVETPEESTVSWSRGGGE